LSLLGSLTAVSAPVAAQVPDLGPNASLRGMQLFPSTSAWNQDISSASVDPNSGTLLASIGLTTGLHPDFGSGAGWTGVPFGIPYIVVSDSQPLVPVFFNYASESDPGPYPIPPDAPIEGGADSTGDRHVLVLNRDSRKLYETFSAFPQADGSWHAGSGAIFDLTSDAQRPLGWTSADAAGLPILPGLVRYDEVVEQGSINHALRFTVQRTRRAFVAPARHFASSLTGAQYPPMGMRVRLKASFNISGFPPQARVVLTALKKYGMFVADNGSNWFLSGAPDSRWNDNDLNSLKQVPGSAFEVVQMGDVITDTVAIPTNLKATAGTDQVSLTWNPSSGATGYTVKRSGVSGGPYVTVASNVASTAYSDTSTAGGKTYYYVVCGQNATGQSLNSGEVFATPTAATIPSAIPAPTNLTAQAVSRSQINLTWTNNDPAATSIKVQYATDGKTFSTIGNFASVGGASIGGLKQNATYYFRVAANDPNGTSAYSNIAKATTPRK
jgi:hypothetical protein